METLLPDRVAAPELERLIRTHQVMVWRYLRLLGVGANEADDLMQETFLRIAEPNARRRAIHAPAAFLRGVARNLLLNYNRAQHRQEPTIEWTDAVDALMADDGRALDDERLDALRHCLPRLGGRARQAVEWHHVDDLSYADTAARLGLRIHGLRALLSRAREALRGCMERYIKGDRES